MAHVKVSWFAQACPVEGSFPGMLTAPLGLTPAPWASPQHPPWPYLWLTLMGDPQLYCLVAKCFECFTGDYCCYVVTKSCPTLCDLTDYSPPGSSVPGVLQARILEWAAISFSRVFQTQELNPEIVSCIGRRNLYHKPLGKPLHVG